MLANMLVQKQAR